MTALIGIAQLLLQFRLLPGQSFFDRRTNRHRWLSVTASALIVLLAFLAAFKLRSDDKSQEAQTAALSRQSRQLDTQTKQLENVGGQLVQIETSLSPFRDLAMKKYPALPENDALARLYLDLKDLARRTADLKIRATTIQSIELRIDVEIPTATRPLSSHPETSAGLQSAVALFDRETTRFRFVTDYQFIHQQVSPTALRLSFVYRPETPAQILGRQLSFLTHMDKLAADYSGFLKDMGVVPDTLRSSAMSIAIWVNGVEVIKR